MAKIKLVFHFSKSGIPSQFQSSVNNVLLFLLLVYKQEHMLENTHTHTHTHTRTHTHNSPTQTVLLLKSQIVIHGSQVILFLRAIQFMFIWWNSFGNVETKPVQFGLLLSKGKDITAIHKAYKIEKQ